MKVCTKCGKDKEDTEFYRRSDTGRLRSHCRTCMNSNTMSRYHHVEGVKEQHRTSSWRHQIKRKYGLTEDDYNRLLAGQDGGCKICGATPDSYGAKYLHIDHNHTTMRVRGLLCNNCNTMLGMSGDSILRLEGGISYLKQEGSYGDESSI